MGTEPQLKLYNTLTREKVDFQPIDRENVRLYVCGPTVYDFAHIGNARPAIVFDVLFRLLRQVYGENHVTYARNITDVDDKINARALRDHPGLPLNEAIRLVTEKTETQYYQDTTALGCLEPTVQPRATDNIAQMIEIIEKLIARGHAYQAAGEVLFDTKSMADYGQLSKRNLDEQQAGARIAVDAHKKSPGDFVLWKLSAENEPGWESPWGRGRPGWHIECSAMSGRYLGDVFDIHGGGLDLIFPHHENEIAQSRCAHGTDVMANVWMHNGFLQVEGRKMSKSEGNFVTIYELLQTEKLGGRTWPGAVLRLAMLMTHYREPIDFSVKRLEEAERLLAKWPAADIGNAKPDATVLVALADDLNTVVAIQALHALAQAANADASILPVFAASAALLGLLPEKVEMDDAVASEIDARVRARLELLKAKNFAEADKIRDTLLAEGIQLKDGKDPATGERITTWEVKR
ncbi:cysteine--tRNA ligase [Agrobacterium rhizogenes]|uniref:Cysteine--tRNA ligase n=2 Tax=Rhizobium rhizogenes TaxID=359 RepID=SYC_RHIR8|nr:MULTISPECIES: cysteine--tRNA ligase [Rhizobium]B9JCA5.1 RecName: Full=Cysteine--tRNA ligase; AltName: Full=Cysteinyl-tRNA synthetase; Short=CysRS [Rhizobium rhizogenes K84]KAA6491153.1 cysteine--tRNA ligase [Agrobacterium sp. ICMP 7243]OCJ25123.1 cysteine--tRNA ligase [Agrobacterium sp. B131/95]OCJ31721.1 cysteine--tRNA ligase [Agrobacterium sp. B133/95]ACM26026.1 cysteinyl-tRNA synthetase protein [Rhizobium rhizogenes K84]EJK85139.1 cysteinyl-tRNA synthetase [Rhizobium sp. AP16]